jgi:hypothetical protein
MLYALLFALAYKSLALFLTVEVAHYISTAYVEALIEFTRAYITVVDLLYSEERLPLRL